MSVRLPGRTISIHAPRTGSDGACRWRLDSPAHFNPRSPHGERPRFTTARCAPCSFQSTLPARGATNWDDINKAYSEYISIHAPRTGSDQRQMADVPQLPSISIHAPRTGSDTSCPTSRQRHSAFQSTLPARGATMSMSITIYPPSISIHAPRTGSDDERGGIAGEVDFNPRSPHGERHTFRCWLLRLGIFQSTLPARGATRAAQHQQKCNLISIHAPRTGSDCSGKSAHLPCCDFNPRSPHGERRTRFICSLPTQTISIHAPRTGSDVLAKRN